MSAPGQAEDPVHECRGPLDLEAQVPGLPVLSAAVAR